MCGRYVASTPPDELAQYFSAAHNEPGRLFSPNFNVAPTQGVYAVYLDGGVRRLDTFRWGLVPFWAKDPRIGNRMINARAETLASKNSFRVPLARRRCIIPADGFYEWRKAEGAKPKQPMYISRPDGEPFAFAGLWEKWRDKANPDPDGHPRELLSCTIVTCAANSKMAEVHNRMPVMLPPSAWDAWLDARGVGTAAATKLLVPAPPSLIRLHPVSTQVNSVRNNGAHLIAEIAAD